MSELIQILEQAGYRPPNSAEELTRELHEIELHFSLRQKRQNCSNPKEIIQKYLRDKELYGSTAGFLKQLRSTFRRFQRFLQNNNGNKPNLILATGDDIRNYFQQMKDKERAPGTMENDLNRLRGFYNWCVSERLIFETPIPPLMKFSYAPVRDIQIPTEEHIKILRHHFNEDFKNWCQINYNDKAFRALRNRTFFAVLHTTGARISEISKVNRNSLDFQLKGIYFETAKQKGGYKKVRFVPMPTNLGEHSAWAYLAEYARWFTEDNSNFFPTPNSLYSNFLRDCSECGVPWYHFHTWRHYYKTWHTAHGTRRDLTEILMGHKLPSSEGTYIHLTDEFIAEHGRMKE